MYEFDLLERLIAHSYILLPPLVTEPHLLYAYAQKLARLINHPLFKKEWVCRYPSLPWSASAISASIRDLDTLRYFMRHNPSKMFFGRCGLSSNKHAQVEWVEAFPRQSWCFGALDGLSAAPRFEFAWVDRIDRALRGSGRPRPNWAFGNFGVSKYCETLTLDTLRQHPDTRWSWGKYGLSSNPGLKESWLRAFPNKPWDFDEVQRHPNFRLEWLRTIPPGKHYRCLSRLHGYALGYTLRSPLEDLHDYQYVIERWESEPWPRCVRRAVQTWDWARCAQRMDRLPGNAFLWHRFDISWIRLFPHMDWNFCQLSSHPNFKIEWVQAYPHENWFFGFGGVSNAPKLDIRWVEQYPQARWSLLGISMSNRFNLAWLDRMPSKLDRSLFGKLFKLKPGQRFEDDVRLCAETKKRDVLTTVAVAGQHNVPPLLRVYMTEFLIPVHFNKNKARQCPPPSTPGRSRGGP